MRASLDVSRKTEPGDKVFSEQEKNDCQRQMEVSPEVGGLLLWHWGIRVGCGVFPPKAPF